MLICTFEDFTLHDFKPFTAKDHWDAVKKVVKEHHFEWTQVENKGDWVVIRFQEGGGNDEYLLWCVEVS